MKYYPRCRQYKKISEFCKRSNRSEDHQFLISMGGETAKYNWDGFIKWQEFCFGKGAWQPSPHITENGSII